MFKHRPSPTAIVAVLALFLALGGSAYAAKSYMITSTDQIKPSVLRSLKGRRGARGAAGAKGAAGPIGPAGPQGPAGPSAVAALVEVEGPSNVIPPVDAESSVATCPAGSRVVSGGGAAITGDANGMAASQASADHQSWIVVGGNTSGVNGSVKALVYCAPSGQAVAAGNRRGAARERAEREAAALVEQVAATIGG